MVFWQFAGIAGAVITGLAFAQARIEANALPETMLDLSSLHKHRNKPPQA